jgi:hypothetical protein
MSLMPEHDLDGDARRAAFRRAVIDRGPDAGRALDHLKVRSLSPAVAALLAQAETAGAAAPEAGRLTTVTGSATVIFFLSDVSTADGPDVLE